MTEKKIIPYIYAEQELESSVLKRALKYEQSGADEIFIYNYSSQEIEQEEFLHTVREVVKQVDIPVLIGCFVKRLEDIKKALYTGAAKIVISYSNLKDKNVIEEGIKRFGKDKIILEFDASTEHNENVLKQEELIKQLKETGTAAILLKHLDITPNTAKRMEQLPLSVYVRDSLLRNDMETLLHIENVVGVATNYYEHKDIIKIKRVLKEAGIETNTFKSTIPFCEFKKNEAGLVPVIVQDYKSSEVLMLAYMNEEAYNTTIATGKMTYYSRSRNSLWVKGETSGHYQYIRSLSIDCDADTILAKVQQIGAACHTGNRSCFYRELVKKEYEDTNPYTVFQDVFEVILDRKKHPKEGSYTNYLFDKGIDKILKKCGEEATEIVIAAKNPDKEELKYEISDFLYHMMVLMAEKGLSLEDIILELLHRK